MGKYREAQVSLNQLKSQILDLNTLWAQPKIKSENRIVSENQPQVEESGNCSLEGAKPVIFFMALKAAALCIRVAESRKPTVASCKAAENSL